MDVEKQRVHNHVLDKEEQKLKEKKMQVGAA